MFTKSIINGGKKGDKYTFYCEFCNKTSTMVFKRLFSAGIIPCPHCKKNTRQEYLKKLFAV